MSDPQHQLRLDVITIFPAYLEPLRHALLGKAIEQGILSVGIHDLRQFATGNHKAVDDAPLGGGPGMVMKPDVWGQALDAVAAGELNADVTSAVPHRNDKLRHDDVRAATAPADRDRASADAISTDNAGPATVPLLLVPTPAGAPFTQADAQAWSRESHIVIACGRYEGIDQRVFDEAASSGRYRVREVSIGDYVLVGGEVAALVIAEAVTRLIPGVLGNTTSHEEDSFSDGLLEGPTYTKPQEWRGIAAPEVLRSGDHAKIARWRRNQSLMRTQRVRPDLIDAARHAGLLDSEDLFELDACRLSTEIFILSGDRPWAKVLKALSKKLKKAGYVVDTIDAEVIETACTPDNVVVASYMQEFDSPPLDPLRKVTITGRSTLEPKDATRAVAHALDAGEHWYGTSWIP
ncbi:tRNA (guanosine(37)-N1)-methyltransferase TrmD [Corynebacterium aquatimens]|uniref:tRNA (guanine-N(1)-)-methyltransferase n=1 Tax=Corynebacterium aquatimens TaxID=1190508 RepID=A0A931E1F4_9CORY|nr:tRNA (guanosine(37)-N1)-methyltransferase TrmD [Corynebacterium aquatimens]MBG6121885.1 tRNA (guanine37-N1)-methyltransferase [Corynebacterium aquatimens]WJY65577.1 tRNA (guanine-N(1)-)-methyltransferase [Corynebacterium aquatimens]